MSKKFGRNQPCWCGSGKKYKKCHLNRESQQNSAHIDAFEVEKNFTKEKRCSVHEELQNQCTKKIIKAHTVSKSSSLKEISENGHVLGLKHGLQNLMKNNGKYLLDKIGINQASTFTGFCSKHDKEIFAPIEDIDFTSTPEQCFLLTYRPIAREQYVKDSQESLFDFIRESDKGQKLTEQIAIQSLKEHLKSNNDLTINDLSYIKSKLDKIFLGKNYKKITHHIFSLASIPKIMASSVLAVEFDFLGNRIQTLDKNKKCPDYMIINIFSSNGNGFFVISALGEHEVATGKFIKSLLGLEENEIGDAITRFIVSYCENFYVAPKWWRELKEESQVNFLQRIFYGIDKEMPHDALINDGITFGAVDFHTYNIVQ